MTKLKEKLFNELDDVLFRANQLSDHRLNKDQLRPDLAIFKRDVVCLVKSLKELINNPKTYEGFQRDDKEENKLH